MQAREVARVRVSRRALIKGLAGAGVAVLLSACKPEVVEKIVKETVVVQQEVKVKETVMVAGTPQVVEKVVTTVVQAPTALKEITISYLSDLKSLSEQDPLVVLFAKFKEKNPGTKIAVLTTASGDDYFTKLVTMTAAKSPPDIFYMPPWNLETFKNEKLLAGLDAYAAVSGLNVNNIPKGLREEYTWDGVLLGLPVLGTILRIWAFNKDAFDAGGVKYPTRSWTYDDMLDQCAKAMKKKGNDVDVWGADLRLQDNAHLLPWLWTWGGDFYNYPQLTKCTMDSKESMAAMQASVDMIRKYKITAPPEIGPADLGISFQTGKIAASAIGTGAWVDPTKPGQFIWNFKWGLVDMPKVKDPRALIHSTGLSLAASSAVRDQAWKLLDFLMSDESQIFYSTAAGKIGGTVTVGAKYAFKNIPAEDQKMVSDGLDYAWSRVHWRTPVWSKSSSNAQQIWSAMWLGKMTVEEACKRATEDTNKMLVEAGVK